MLGSNALNIGIMNYHEGLMNRCLTHIKQTVKTPYKLTLINNGGLEKEDISEFVNDDTVIINNDPGLGFVKGFNQLASLIDGDFIFINVDMDVRENTIDELIKLSNENKNFGIISTEEYKPDSIIKTTMTGNKYKYKDDLKKAEWVAYGCCYFRHEMIKQIGLLDDKFFFWYCDIEYSRRANENGWLVGFAPNISVFHAGHKSYKQLKDRDKFKANFDNDIQRAKKLKLFKEPPKPPPAMYDCQHNWVMQPIDNATEPPYYINICTKCKEKE